MNEQSTNFENAPLEASQGTVLSRLLRVASLGMMGLSLALANQLPASAAEAQLGPAVTVTGTRNPDATPSELTYLAAAHRKLQAASRYPSGRDMSLYRPSGNTTVWADVARDGRVVARSVDQSSGNALLDDMARSLVGRTRFPSFAAGDWGGTPTHRFGVSYQFVGDAMTAGAAGHAATTSVR